MSALHFLSNAVFENVVLGFTISLFVVKTTDINHLSFLTSNTHSTKMDSL